MIPANDNELPKTQQEAKLTGAPYYRPDKPCRCGKIITRYTSCGACVSCAVERATKRYQGDIAAKKAYDRRRYQDNPKTRLGANQWRVKNPEKARDYAKQWAEDNAEKVDESRKKWAANNPEAVRSNSRARRARRCGAEGFHKANEIAAILKRQKHKCAECGVSVRDKGSAEVDHIMPLALGGSNWPSNLQILCVKCNRKKGAKHPLQHARENGRLL